jgi:hypothetical protein
VKRVPLFTHPFCLVGAPTVPLVQKFTRSGYIFLLRPAVRLYLLPSQLKSLPYKNSLAQTLSNTLTFNLQPSTLPTMFHPSTISRLRALFALPRTFSFSIPAAKARAKNWEPALRLPSLPPFTHNTEDYVPSMTTYSVFDPCALCPLLMSGSALSMPGMRDSSSSNATISERPATPSLNTKAIVKAYTPWPYALPGLFRPRTGTTYAMVYGDGDEGRDGGRWVQKVLYGVPDPSQVTERGTGRVWRGMVHGAWC